MRFGPFWMAISAKQRHDFYEAFKLFDKDGDGKISTEELSTVMRSLGHNPTPAELREMIGMGVQGQFTARGGTIDFEGFCQLMTRKMKDVDSEMELRDAFRVLDQDEKGYITCKEMASVCKVLGEDLDEDEVNDMVSEAISNFKGEIYYDGFVKILLAN